MCGIIGTVCGGLYKVCTNSGNIFHALQHVLINTCSVLIGKRKAAPKFCRGRAAEYWLEENQAALCSFPCSSIYA